MIRKPIIACFTAVAIEWDEEFKRATLVGGDQSGRSVSVHNLAYGDVVAVALGRELRDAKATEDSKREDATL